MSLQYDVKGPIVFLDKNGQAYQQRVKVIRNRRGQFIITQGLHAGDRVVVDGIQNNIQTGDTLSSIRPTQHE